MGRGPGKNQPELLKFDSVPAGCVSGPGWDLPATEALLSPHQPVSRVASLSFSAGSLHAFHGAGAVANVGEGGSLGRGAGPPTPRKEVSPVPTGPQGESCLRDPGWSSSTCLFLWDSPVLPAAPDPPPRHEVPASSTVCRRRVDLAPAPPLPPKVAAQVSPGGCPPGCTPLPSAEGPPRKVHFHPCQPHVQAP